MNKRETILFIGGGVETLPGIKTARSMDLNIIVSDISPDAPCAKISDHFICADTYDVEATLAGVNSFIKNFGRIDAVICMASDVPLTVASVASEFDLVGIPISTALAVTDKIIMKDKFKANDLPIPWYSQIKNLEHFKLLAEQKGLPLIIKPVDSRGARGVLLLTEGVDLEWAFKIAKSNSPTGRVMIESYLYGPQISTEALVVNSKVFTLGISDRNYEFLEKYAPYIIENGGSLPSHLPSEDLNKIVKTFERTADALDIKNGVIKGDMVLCEGEPFIIEIAARLSGGYFCSHEIPLNTGVDFVGKAIEIALGRKIEIDSLYQKHNTPVAQRYFFPKPGRVTKITVPDWIKKNNDIKLMEIRCKVGDIIPDIVHHPSRAGLVITSSTTLSKAIALAEEVVNSIGIFTTK